MQIRPRVLIVSDDPMGGHRAAANAVNQALRDAYPVDSKVVDFHDMSSPERKAQRERWNPCNVVDKDAARRDFDQAMHPSLLTRMVWRFFVPERKHRDIPEAQALVAREDPDILLSVHMDTGAMSKAWQKNDALKAPAHCVVTDYVAHYVWATSSIARYYVASDDVKKDLQSYGVSADKIMVTGIPVSPQLVAPDARPHAEVKKALGLDPDLPVIMIMGGSKGDQQYVPILQALQERGNTAQVVALCGRNEDRRRAVEQFGSTLDFPVHARPFVDMRDYYHAADVVVTKPGGLTTAEVLAKGKAMIAVSPYAGMEEQQVQRLLKAGVARFGDTAQSAAAQAIELIAHPDEKARLEAVAQAFGRPDAAQRIADDLLAHRRA